MAITDETAALVAAQLTMAWAARSGFRGQDALEPIEGEVLDQYLRFRQLVAERDLGPGVIINETIG